MHGEPPNGARRRALSIGVSRSLNCGTVPCPGRSFMRKRRDRGRALGHAMEPTGSRERGGVSGRSVEGDAAPAAGEVGDKAGCLLGLALGDREPQFRAGGVEALVEDGRVGESRKPGLDQRQVAKLRCSRPSTMALISTRAAPRRQSAAVPP